jgi:GIY-YIG catalytic domain
MQTIYLLRDPRNHAPRYVGVTACSIRKRFREHCNDKRKTHRTAWIKGLRKIGLYPVIEILEQVEDHHRVDAEQAWILGFRQAGADLVNVTDGGEGTVGIVRDARQRENMRNARMRMSDEKRKTLASLAAKSRTGYKHKAETIEKIRMSNIGIKKFPHTDEWKRQASLRSRLPGNIEHCRKMAESRRGIPRPAHVIEALRMANKKRWDNYRTMKGI